MRPTHLLGSIAHFYMGEAPSFVALLVGIGLIVLIYKLFDEILLPCLSIGAGVAAFTLARVLFFRTFLYGWTGGINIVLTIIIAAIVAAITWFAVSNFADAEPALHYPGHIGHPTDNTVRGYAGPGMLGLGRLDGNVIDVRTDPDHDPEWEERFHS